MDQVLQSLVLPNTKFAAPTEMYVRLLNELCYIDYKDLYLILKPCGRASFDTFYSSFTVNHWKNKTNIKNLFFKIRGSGKFGVSIFLNKIGNYPKLINYQKINSGNIEETIIDVENWQELESGMLFILIEAYEETVIEGGYFGTKENPKREVNLGIVITHFNRQQYVIPAIKRLKEELFSDYLYKNNIELIVVDNSQNLPDLQSENVTIIPNDNLGGSGGFARGLLHLTTQSKFSHCLFMDDDATCEIESIKRTFAFMQYSKIEKLAICGSLLRETEPYRLMEMGAKFDGYVKPIKVGLDMRNVGDLMSSEVEHVKPDYGAWWFFCFKIKEVEEFPFPFFVRGDDSRFSIRNKFKIMGMNGISVWGEDFASKTSPMNCYLDMRYHLLHQINLIKKNRLFLIKHILKFTLVQLASYNYTSAEAALEGAADFSRGPKIFKKHGNIKLARERISRLGNSEKLKPNFIDETEFGHGPVHESKLRCFIRRFTINGTLFPFLFIRHNIIFQFKEFSANTCQTFGFKKIAYEYEPHKTGYIAEYNYLKTLRILRKLLITLLVIYVKFDFLKKDFRLNAPKLSSKEFWENTYFKK